jgi:hypothetical protein
MIMIMMMIMITIMIIIIMIIIDTCPYYLAYLEVLDIFVCDD